MRQSCATAKLQALPASSNVFVVVGSGVGILILLLEDILAEDTGVEEDDSTSSASVGRGRCVVETGLSVCQTCP
jgi:hypothetical protein